MTKFTKDYNIFILPYIINHSYKVKVTHINDPHSFYVCSSDLSYTELDILEERDEIVRPVDLMSNSIVVYNSITSNRCVRGRILQHCEAANNTYDILAIDYGYINKSVELNDIFMPKSSMDIPPLARHCKLANCEPNGLCFMDKDTEAMQTYVGDEPCLMLVKGVEDGKTLVELRNTCPNDIATMLAITHFTNLGVNLKAIHNFGINKQEISEFSLKNVKVNDVIHVRLLDTKTQYPNTFYVADVDDYRNYIDGRREFTDYCRYEMAIELKNLKVGKSVGYKPQFSRFYERAFVKNILDDRDKVSLLLIDTGVTEEPLRESIKDIKFKKSFTLPGIAFQCTFINGIEHKGLSEHVLPGMEVWIKIKETGDTNIVEVVSNPCQF